MNRRITKECSADTLDVSRGSGAVGAGGVTTSGGTSVTSSLSDSVSESVNISIKGIVDIGLSNSTTWGKSFSTGHSHGTQVNGGVQYGYQGDPWIVPNIATVSGDFHATIDGINWTFATVDITGTGVANPDDGDAAFGATMNVAAPSRTVRGEAVVPELVGRMTHLFTSADHPPSIGHLIDIKGESACYAG